MYLGLKVAIENCLGATSNNCRGSKIFEECFDLEIISYSSDPSCLESGGCHSNNQNTYVIPLWIILIKTQLDQKLSTMEIVNGYVKLQSHPKMACLI